MGARKRGQWNSPFCCPGFALGSWGTLTCRLALSHFVVSCYRSRVRSGWETRLVVASSFPLGRAGRYIRPPNRFRIRHLARRTTLQHKNYQSHLLLPPKSPNFHDTPSTIFITLFSTFKRNRFPATYFC